MKKVTILFLCAALLLSLFAGCGENSGTPAESAQTTVPTQSPEEAAVFKVLMIGQSHAQDSVWFLYDVLKAEMLDREFLVADVYQPLNLAQHIENIKTDAAVYDYIEFKDGTANKIEGYRIDVALTLISCSTAALRSSMPARPTACRRRMWSGNTTCTGIIPT